MNSHKSQLKPIYISLIIASLISPLFAIAPTVAQFAPRHRKPPGEYTRTAGSRGCPGENIPLTLLAPQTYISETISQYPTFAWFVSRPQPVKFRLFELETGRKPKQIGNYIELQTTQGINKFSWPENSPKLIIGKSYLWQVAIQCPMGTAVQRAEFQVIEIPSVLKTQISQVTNQLQIAEVYAKAGLWYDAFKAAIESIPENKLGKLGSSLVRELAQSEIAERREEINRINHLQAIAEQEQ